MLCIVIKPTTVPHSQDSAAEPAGFYQRDMVALDRALGTLVCILTAGY